MRAFTYADRPDLAERTGELEDVLTAFLGHGEIAVRHWGKLRPELPELQLVLWTTTAIASWGMRGRCPPARPNVWMRHPVEW